jgi:hypothetical protein
MLKRRATQVYHEQYFKEFLTLEKKRCERSKGHMLVMLADLSRFHDKSERLKIAEVMAEVLSNVTRDTDIRGWYVEDLVIGVLFTEMAREEATLPTTARHIANKCEGRLSSCIGADSFSRIEITWHLFPEESPRRSVHQGPKRQAEFSSIERELTKRRIHLVGKRLMEVIRSIFAPVPAGMGRDSASPAHQASGSVSRLFRRLLS